MKTLQNLFDSVLTDVTKGIQEEDLVQVTLECPDLDFPIRLPLMQMNQLTSELLLTEIERVLQSSEQFVLDHCVQLNITHVSLPKGGTGKRCDYVDTERFLKDKRCIIQIQNKDDMCCVRVIVTAKAKIDGHEQWNSIQRGRRIQEELALELHTKAGVPLHQCGIEDVKTFQRFLVGYQIHVISREHFNGIVYHGPTAEKKIYLYYHDNHYDVITSMTAFLSRTYFCTNCYKGYNTKEEHACNNVCHNCLKIHDQTEDDWIHCQDCGRCFKGPTCFNLHKKTTPSGNATCTYYKCKNCGQTVNKRVGDHTCGNVYCKTSKDYYPSGHQCYMLPVDYDRQKKQTYIFFDFECTQDDRIQCQQGYQSDDNGECIHCKSPRCGVFEHKPNLCIVHRVCLKCMDQGVDKDSIYQTYGKNELVFAGPNTTEHFCQWLFSGENEGATVIAHNFKGCDSLPILEYLYQNGVKPTIIANGAKNMHIEVPGCRVRMEREQISRTQSSTRRTLLQLGCHETERQKSLLHVV